MTHEHTSQTDVFEDTIGGQIMRVGDRYPGSLSGYTRLSLAESGTGLFVYRQTGGDRILHPDTMQDPPYTEGTDIEMLLGNKPPSYRQDTPYIEGTDIERLLENKPPSNRRAIYFYGGGEGTPAKWSFVQAHRDQQAQQDDVIHHLIRAIEEVAKQASKTNWDGEDALPVAPETAQIAKKLVRFFPILSEVPDVSASPHGEIDFDWAIDRRTMLTIGVCEPPDHDILFVANIGKSEFRGKEPWENELPQLAKCCFERMKGLL